MSREVIDRTSLKKAVEKIEMPDSMRSRIIVNCEAQLAGVSETSGLCSSDISRKEICMTNKSNRKIKKSYLAICAVVVLCICLPVAGMAMGNAGFFKDIKAPGGAVVGTAYEQASSEITVSADYTEGQIKVSAELLKPDAAPYGFIDELYIGEYSIINKAGDVVASGNIEDLSAFAAVDGADLEINLAVSELSVGDYILKINSFVGTAKAEQPLTISGPWECEFAV